MKILRLIATESYMELLLSDMRVVRVTGKLAENGFVGYKDSNWLVVREMSCTYKAVGIQDVEGRVSECEKDDVIQAVSEYLAEIDSRAKITFE